MHILNLLEKDKIPFKRTSSTVYTSPCPKCKEGNNRFLIYVNQDIGGRFWCRQCKVSGNVISYLMKFHNENYYDACAIAGVQPSIKRGFDRKSFLETPIQWEPKPLELPSDNWQAKAWDLVKWAHSEFFRPENQGILEKLENERGLKPETIRKFKLGYIEKDLDLDSLGWDLPLILDYTGDLQRLYIPAGLLIPGIAHRTICRLRIRVFNRKDGMRKYHMIQGSSNHPLVIQNQKPYAIVVESDLDAMLLDQEAGDLVSVISLGSCSNKPDARACQLLSEAEIILISLDSDDAGSKAFYSWWLKHFPKAIHWPVIEGKDPTEAYINGLDIRQWVQAGIEDALTGSDEDLLSEMDDTIEPESGFITNYETFQEYFDRYNNVETLALDYFEMKDPEEGLCAEYIQIYSGGLPLISLNLLEMEDDQVESLGALMSNSGEKVVYDAKLILLNLKRYSIPVEGQIFDIKLAEQVMMAGLEIEGDTLNDLADQYLYSDRFSGNHFQNDHNTESMEMLLKLKETLFAKLTDEGLMPTAELEFECVKPVTDMEYNGMPVDMDRAVSLSIQLQQDKDDLKLRLKAELGDINLESSGQVLKSLQEKEFTLLDTEKETLKPLVKDHLIVKDLMNYRTISNGLSTVKTIIKYTDKESKRIFPKYNQLGTDTGRMSCVHPNLQGMPKDPRFRSLFKAGCGRKLIVADYSQIELRIIAEMTNDEKMINAFDNDRDLHALTASIITGKKEVSLGERQKAKAVNFGFAFGMRAEGFVKYALTSYDVIVSLQEAESFRERYFQTYQGVKAWHDEQALIASTCLKTIGGRTRKFREEASFTKGLNTPAQGTGADILKTALSMLHENLKNTGALIICSVHDEIILEVPEDEASEFKRVLKDTMIKAGQIYISKVPVKVDVEIAGDWSGKN